MSGRRAVVRELLKRDPTLGERSREILSDLAGHGGERTVLELARALGVPVHHLYDDLALLAERGLITRTRKRNPRAFRIAPPEEFLERLTAPARDLLRAAEDARPYLEERYEVDPSPPPPVRGSDDPARTDERRAGALARLATRIRFASGSVRIGSPEGVGVLELLGLLDPICRAAGRLPPGSVRLLLPPPAAGSPVERETERLRAHGVAVRQGAGLESTVFVVDRELSIVELPGSERSARPPSVLEAPWTGFGRDLARLLDEEWERAGTVEGDLLGSEPLEGAHPTEEVRARPAGLLGRPSPDLRAVG